MGAPTSQKADARPISFVLTDGEGQTTTVGLYIRPEDLTRQEPARQAVTQTFGGAFLDDFGRGVQVITINGHTGWRGGNDGDGVAGFAKLRTTVWEQWHKARQTAVGQGKAPDAVELVFADALDDITVVVAPGEFVLKRNRQRPLLMMYSLRMTVLKETLGKSPVDALHLSGPLGSTGDDTLTAGMESLSGSAKSLLSSAGGASSFLPSGLVGPGASLMKLGAAAYQSSINAVQGASGLFSPDATSLISASRSLSIAGRNAFAMVAALPGIPEDALFAAGRVAAAFGNAYCVLRNAFVTVPQYPDYSAVYGASNCSSTVGGSPISSLLGSNAFDTVLPAGTSPVSIGAAAQAQLEVLTYSDPVLAPMGADELSSRLSLISSGVRLA